MMEMFFVDHIQGRPKASDRSSRKNRLWKWNPSCNSEASGKIVVSATKKHPSKDKTRLNNKGLVTPLSFYLLFSRNLLNWHSPFPRVAGTPNRPGSIRERRC